MSKSGLRFLLVLTLAPRGFSPGTPVFSSPQKSTNSNLTWNPRATGLSVKSTVICHPLSVKCHKVEDSIPFLLGYISRTKSTSFPGPFPSLWGKGKVLGMRLGPNSNKSSQVPQWLICCPWGHVQRSHL